jgi:hypothetical protein
VPRQDQISAIPASEPHGFQAGGRRRASSCQIAHGTERISGHPRSTSRISAGPGSAPLASALPKLTMRVRFPSPAPLRPGRTSGARSASLTRCPFRGRLGARAPRPSDLRPRPGRTRRRWPAPGPGGSPSQRGRDVRRGQLHGLAVDQVPAPAHDRLGPASEPEPASDVRRRALLGHGDPRRVVIRRWATPSRTRDGTIGLGTGRLLLNSSRTVPVARTTAPHRIRHLPAIRGQWLALV